MLGKLETFGKFHENLREIKVFCTIFHSLSCILLSRKYIFLRPACFLSLRTTQHDFWSATQRGADYAKGLETCRSRYHWYICIWTGSGTGSVQIPKQFGFGTGNFGKCEWYLRQSAPKAAPDVCAFVRACVRTLIGI